MAVDKLVDSTQLDADLTSVANAIRAKTGGSASLAFPTDFVSEIGSISGGGGDTPVEENDVTFYDYDGTVVASYTEAQAYALTEHPANPSHDGLVAQGWNWSLADIRAQIDDCPGGTIDIGQNYTTDDGKTRLYIYIPDNTPASRMTYYVGFSATVVGGVEIEWGDGTSELNTATAATAYPHTYAAGGRYLVTLNVTSGTATLGGSTATTAYGLNGTGNVWNAVRIQKAEIGANMNLGDYAFDFSIGLETVTIPTTVTTLGTRCLQNQRKLAALIVPSCSVGLLAFNSGYVRVFSNARGNALSRPFDSPFMSRITLVSKNGSLDSSYCYGHTNLAKAVIPESVTRILRQLFYECSVLTTLTIPSGVTSIADQAFYNCRGMAEYHLKPTTPPTLSNTNAFQNIPSDCVIYVPYSSDHSILTAYQSATNWATYASYMQEEEE